jgi:hypothetical protein
VQLHRIAPPTSSSLVSAIQVSRGRGTAPVVGQVKLQCTPPPWDLSTQPPQQAQKHIKMENDVKHTPAAGGFEARTLEALRAAASDAEEVMWAAACTAASEYARNTGQSVANLVGCRVGVSIRACAHVSGMLGARPLHAVQFWGQDHTASQSSAGLAVTAVLGTRQWTAQTHLEDSGPSSVSC